MTESGDRQRPDVPYRRAVVGPDEDGLPLAMACAVLGLADEAEFPIRLAHGGIWIDRHRATTGDIVVAASTILTVHLPPGGTYPTVELTAGDVLYEDTALVVLNKPPGIYVTMTPWDTVGNVRAALDRLLRHRDGDRTPIHLAHQLDRDTSGVLVATKDSAANAALQHAFASRAVHKRYLCICAGTPLHDSWTAESGHGRGAHGLFRSYPLDQVGQLLPVGEQTIKYMATDFRVIRRFGQAALVEAFPHTGRTHQIRLHLQAAGHPLLGDGRYGGPLAVGDLALSHHLLHAEQLRLPHPLTGQPLDLVAARPPLWASVLARLEVPSTATA